MDHGKREVMEPSVVLFFFLSLSRAIVNASISMRDPKKRINFDTLTRSLPVPDSPIHRTATDQEAMLKLSDEKEREEEAPGVASAAATKGGGEEETPASLRRRRRRRQWQGGSGSGGGSGGGASVVCKGEGCRSSRRLRRVQAPPRRRRS